MILQQTERLFHSVHVAYLQRDARVEPKFPVRYGYRRLMELAPDGWMLSIEDDDRFEECYRKKLDRLRGRQDGHLLQTISDEESGRPLVLLCYEAHSADCHRGQFARWWEERTGQQVPELQHRGSVAHSERPEQPQLFTEREEQA